MDPCTLAETGISLLTYALIAFGFVTVAFVLLGRVHKLKPFIATLALILTFSLVLAPVSTFAQSTEDCPDEDQPSIALGLVDDFAALQIPNGDTVYETATYLAILGNDISPDGDPYDWDTIDLDPSTPGQQTSFNLLHPDNDTFICGTVAVSTFGVLAVSLTYQCWDEDFINFDTIPSSYTIAPFQYTVQTIGSIDPPAPAMVTIATQVGAVEGVVLAESDIWCALYTSFSVLDNDATDSGDLDPLTIDLDPTTPGRQTSVVHTNNGGTITLTVDTDGMVTFVDDGYFSEQSYAHFYYTVQNTNGDTSNIALIHPTLLDLCE